MGLPLLGAPVEGKLSLTLYKEWVLNLLATNYLFSMFHTFASFRYSFYAFWCFSVWQHCYGGALVLRTQGEQPCEPSHTGQDTYFIARDTTTWIPSYIGFRMGKGSSISQVSISLSHGIKNKMKELDERAQMTWSQPSTKVYTLFKHGMGNSLHIDFFDYS